MAPKEKSTNNNSNGENKSKSVTLLELIRDSLPSDSTASVIGHSMDLTDLSQKAGMSDPEFIHFLQANRGLFVRSKQASKFSGPATFQFASGYENVEDVIEFIKSSTQRRVIPIIRPRKSEYRGSH